MLAGGRHHGIIHATPGEPSEQHRFVMLQDVPIEYRRPSTDAPSRTMPWWVRLTLAFVVLMAAVVIFGFLQFLAYAPYRPPLDMEPLLSDGERAIVRLLQTLCVGVVVASLVYVGIIIRKRRLVGR